MIKEEISSEPSERPRGLRHRILLPTAHYIAELLALNAIFRIPSPHLSVQDLVLGP